MVLPYRCPDCKVIHTDPVDAAFVLSVRCIACELEGELADFRLIDERELPAAA